MKDALRGFSALLLVCAFSAHARSQEQSAIAAETSPVGISYPNTSDGLRMQLEELRSGAKSGNDKEAKALVKQTEIPNARSWFYSMYPADKAESWIGSYETGLVENEENFHRLFIRLATAEGRIEVRKVNDSPQPEKALEWGLLNSARAPLDVYFAGWKPGLPSDSQMEAIGYFFFIDGMFRWDSLSHPMRPRIDQSRFATTSDSSQEELPVSGPVFTVGPGVSAPTVILQKEAQYTDSARKARFEGVTMLTLVVDIDGRAKQIKVSQSLRGDLDEKAMEAIRASRFRPAMRKGQPVPVRIMVQVRFRLDKHK